MKTLDECKMYQGALSEAVYLNTSEDYVFVASTSLHEMTEHAHGFKTIVLEWAIEQLTQITEARSSYGHSLIEAFKMYEDTDRKSFKYSYALLMISAVPAQAWLAVGNTVPDANLVHLYASRQTRRNRLAWFEHACPIFKR